MNVDWLKISESAIGPLLGTLVGGGITLFGIFFKERFDRRKAVQSWYEEEFITNGIDRIMAYVMTAHYRLLEQAKSETMLKDVETVPFPMDPLNRLFTILHTSELTALIMVLNIAIAKPLPAEVKEGLMSLVTVAETCVYALQHVLLTIRIKKKSDVYKISERKDVAKVLEFIQKSAGEAHKALNEAGEQAKEFANSQKKNQVRKR